MNDIEDISQIAGKFKKVAEVKAYADKLFIALKTATELLQKKELEINHLKELLSNTVPLINQTTLVPHNIDPAVLLCEMEILRLQEIVKDRSLNFEETKRFSILVNDLLSLKKSKENEDPEEDHKIKIIDDHQLIQIAKKSEI